MSLREWIAVILHAKGDTLLRIHAKGNTLLRIHAKGDTLQRIHAKGDNLLRIHAKGDNKQQPLRGGAKLLYLFDEALIVLDRVKRSQRHHRSLKACVILRRQSEYKESLG